jgi:hypothetical protein
LLQGLLLLTVFVIKCDFIPGLIYGLVRLQPAGSAAGQGCGMASIIEYTVVSMAYKTRFQQPTHAGLGMWF